MVIRLRAPVGADPRAVEGLLADSVRTEDVLARYAADDYEVMVVGVDAAQGEAAASRLLQELADGLGCARGSIAAGVAVVGRDGSTADELVTAAAAALAGEPSSAVAPQIVPGSQLEAVIREVTRVAASELPVLVLGETGTGKELCAEAVHRLSPRHGAPLLRLNCAAFPAELLEAELFGYERGAFTGASHAKPGLLETAAGGTVFIDEVGELSPATQVKLLRVLERREVQRIGALEPSSIDVRFVAATHRDLDAEIAAGRFRQDLYFRIAGYTVHVPPLRARVDEIAPLARHFAARAAEAAGRPAPELTDGALALLAGYPWPGNVRELRNVIERAVVLAGRGAIRPEHLPTDKFRSTVLAPARPRRVTAEAPPPPAFDATAPVERFELNEFASGPPTMPTLRAADLRADFRERERAAILRALEDCAGNQTRAAQRLGISRGTLVAKLDAYGVPRPRKPPR